MIVMGKDEESGWIWAEVGGVGFEFGIEVVIQMEVGGEVKKLMVVLTLQSPCLAGLARDERPKEGTFPSSLAS